MRVAVIWLREDRGGTSGKDEQAIQVTAKNQVVLIFRG